MGAGDSKLKKKEIKQWQEQYGLSKDKVQITFKAFKKHKDSGNHISREKFIDIMTAQGGNDKFFANAIFDSFDKDKSGTIDIREYMSLMGVTFGGGVEEKLEASFNLFDENGDGVLSQDEIERMAAFVYKSTIGEGTKSPLSLKQQKIIHNIVQEVFDKVDTDKNQKLDLDEFKRGFKEQPEICDFFKQF